MKWFKQFLYHPWYWLVLPRLEIYYRPNTGGKWKDVGLQIGFLCCTAHFEVGEKRPWEVTND